MTTVGRRAVIGGALGVAALGLARCGKPPRRPELVSGPLRSTHWPGRDIRWQLTTPPADETDPLPVVVVLHGKGGDASHAFRILHLEDHAAASRLTLASVDGGDFYWHARRAGVDTGAMLPPGLRLRRERDDLPERAARLASEAEVRALAEDYNARVEAFWRLPAESRWAAVPGLADVEALVEGWERDRPSPQSAPVEPPAQLPARRRWWRRR